MQPVQELVRLTFDRVSGTVHINTGASSRVHGRSAYLCRREPCLEAALKGPRLKRALAGRGSPGKDPAQRRPVAWPLESQLIHTLRRLCTESARSCHNTPSKEGL